MPSARLPLTDDQIRVSSVQAKDAHQYGKEHILDGNPATCWQSEGYQTWDFYYDLRSRQRGQTEMTVCPVEGGNEFRSGRNETDDAIFDQNELVTEIEEPPTTQRWEERANRLLLLGGSCAGGFGAAQWIIIKFADKVRLDEIRIQFRTGLAAKSFSVRNLDPHDKEIDMYFPDDTDAVQIFPVPSNAGLLHHIKLAFDCSTDFYGRISVASLEFYGSS